MDLFLTKKSCNFIVEIFGWSGQWPGNNGCWGGRRKSYLCVLATSLAKLKGTIKDNILFIKLPKIQFSCQFPQQRTSFSWPEVGGCLVVMAETQAVSMAVFLLPNAGRLSGKWVYYHFAFPWIPSFHASLSFELSEELKEAQSGVLAQRLKVST